MVLANGLRRCMRHLATACSRSPCLCCRISPISTISIRSRREPNVRLLLLRPGHAPAAGDRSRAAARLESDHRRSQGHARGGLGYRHQGPCRAAAAASSASAAAIRCWAKASPIRKASKARPTPIAGLGLLDVETVMTSEKMLINVSGRSVDGDVPFSGFEMHMGRTDGPDCARPLAHLCGWTERRRRLARTAASPALMCMASSMTMRSAGTFSKSSADSPAIFLMKAGSKTCSMRFAAHLETHLDLDRLLSLAD